jgi:hypothetical protein
LFECISREERMVYKKTELSRKLIQKTPRRLL